MCCVPPHTDPSWGEPFISKTQTTKKMIKNIHKSPKKCRPTDGIVIQMRWNSCIIHSRYLKWKKPQMWLWKSKNSIANRTQNRDSNRCYDDIHWKQIYFSHKTFIFIIAFCVNRFWFVRLLNAFKKTELTQILFFCEINDMQTYYVIFKFFKYTQKNYLRINMYVNIFQTEKKNTNWNFIRLLTEISNWLTNEMMSLKFIANDA